MTEDQYTEGNWQGAQSVVQKPITSGIVSKPKNPTKVSTITFTAPGNITKGQSVTLTLSNFGYSNLYDCSTWEYYWKKPTPSSSEGEYSYYGYYPGTSSSTTKTFLVKQE